MGVAVGVDSFRFLEFFVGSDIIGVTKWEYFGNCSQNGLVFCEVFMGESFRIMTEEELRRCYVGKYIDTTHGYGWDDKKKCYGDMGVWQIFNALRAYYRKKATDDTGHVFHDIATHMAQIEVDTFLVLRAKGKEISEPAVPGAGPTVASLSQDGCGNELYDITEFGGKEDLDPIAMMTWVFNHLAVKGVKPADAPSPGAYNYLRFVQMNQDNMVDFYTKAFPRLIPAKSAQEDSNKFHDDGRTTFDLLDRVLKEGQPVTEQVPVLRPLLP